MEWQTVLIAFGVPVLSFVTGYLTNRLAGRDLRSRLKSDVELLGTLPELSTAKESLRSNIDARIAVLVRKSEPAVPALHLILGAPTPAARSAWRLVGLGLFLGASMVVVSATGLVIIGGGAEEFTFSDSVRSIFAQVYRFSIYAGTAMIAGTMIAATVYVIVRSRRAIFSD